MKIIILIKSIEILEFLDNPTTAKHMIRGCFFNKEPGEKHF